MRSLCAVLLAAVFLVGFTAGADDPEPVRSYEPTEKISEHTDNPIGDFDQVTIVV